MTGNIMVVYDIYSNNDDVAEVTTNHLSNNDKVLNFNKPLNNISILFKKIDEQ